MKETLRLNTDLILAFFADDEARSQIPYSCDYGTGSRQAFESQVKINYNDYLVDYVQYPRRMKEY